jgi:hypothetical protein
MQTEFQKVIKRASWQSFAIILTTVSGVLTMPEVRELVAIYPKQLAFLAVFSVIVMGATKILNNFIQMRAEIKKFQ